MINVAELLKHMIRRRGGVVEEEHDPCVDKGTVVGCHDNGSLVVRVVRGELVDGIQEIGGLVGREHIVASPDLVSLAMRRKPK